ncbi:Gp49 family protein [Acinetobacter brisouii]
MPNEKEIEQEIQDKGLNAPRLTPTDINAVIADEYYFTAKDGVVGGMDAYNAMGFHESLKTLTFCVLILKNGFKVVGQSDCASPENFDAEIGRKVAREDARNKIWMLEGYLLKEKLYQAKLDQQF